MIKEERIRYGFFDVEVKDSGILVYKKRFPNLIMNAVFNEEIDIYRGVSANLEIMHCAIGDDDGTVLPLAGTNLILGNEVYRVPVESGPTRIETGYITTEFVILKSEANGETIKEIGIFVGDQSEDWDLGGGGDPGDGADTGTLMSRVYMIPNVSKTASKEITIRRIDIVQRPTIV